ncbi:glycoside hydrolase family 3 N-terminal domain-containing protein [Neptunicella sp.]|uniref:glycoside hydrolase family 3 N-terminal domain-containing protein n=1 Tax=Neptunicella sp. TaxID=2125986 RepID=UPI003F68FF4E
MPHHRKTILTTLLSAALSAVLLSSCASSENTEENRSSASLWPSVHSPMEDNQGDRAFVTDLVAKMTVEEKVGQVLQAEIQTISPDEARQYHIGSILNGGGSVPNRNSNATASDWAAFADQYYQASIDDKNGRTGIPIFWGTDAVHGHNNVKGATIFPHNIGLGATHDPDLIRKIGEVTAREVRATGIEWVFAPTLAVARNDRWGRTYESYSENPELVAQYASQMVLGLQGSPGSDAFLDESHVAATAKHFLADGGTLGGDDQGNAQLSEAELVSIHNAGYPEAIKAGVQSVMASFSSWNGKKMHGNHYLLTDVLKTRMGFDGLIVGDWNGHGQVPNCTNDSCAQSMNAGLDLYMVPYDWKSMYSKTLAQVNAGEIPMARLDDAVTRILLVKKHLGLFDGKKPSERQLGGKNQLIGADAHRLVARQAVRESLVLLKNSQHILPLKSGQRILVAGDHADNIGKQSGGWSVSWQGTGSKNSDFPGATSIYQGIEQAAKAAGSTAILSVDGTFEQKPDVAIVVFGEDPYAEGQGDINTLEFEPGNKQSLALLKSLKAQNIPVVSVFISGRPLWVNPELNASDAFVAAWLPGSEGAGVADVLFADKTGQPLYDFSGKLSFSWPKSPLQDQLNIGDKDYDPLFAYGYGLTYQDNGELATLAEKLEGVASDQPQDIALYNARPLEPWHAFIKNSDKNQIFSGAFAELTDGTAKLITSDKDVQEDALTFSFKDSWFYSLYFEGGKPLDLSPFLANGTVEFDIRIEDFAKTALDLSISCGDDCDSKVRLREWAQQAEGKGWQHLSIPMQCFTKQGATFGKVNHPFNLETGGQGQLSIANIRFNVTGKGNFDCPERDKLAITPDTLNEYWSVDWWMPRHQEKLAQAKLGEADLLLIGDSITHGWENTGKEVWQQYFGDINTMNIGFSGDRTENVLWRLQHHEVDGINPKLAIMMIGTNNTGHRLDSPASIAAGVEHILTELTERLPNTKVLLLAIFPRGPDQDDKLRQNNQQTNKLLKQLAVLHNAIFVNINQHFLADDGTLSKEIMPDLLHPNADGYKIWAEQIKPYIDKYVR